MSWDTEDRGDELDNRGTGAAGPAALTGRGHWPAVLGYLLLTGAVLWPAVRHFGSRPMTNVLDGAVFRWVWGYMPRAVGEGTNPFQTDLQFHPEGLDLRLTTTAPLVAFSTWPVRATLGVAAQINLVQLVSMFTAGLATYFLAHRICRHRFAAFLAGAAYALYPGRFVHADDGHLNLVETGVIPFTLLLLLRFVDVPTVGRAVALGVMGGATFLIDPQLAVFTAVGLVVMGITHRRALVSAARPFAVAAVAAFVVAGPLLLPMADALVAGKSGTEDPTGSTLQYSASPLSWVVPPTEQLLLGQVWSIERLTPNMEGTVYPGLVMLGLAVAGVSLSRREDRRGWVAIAVVGFVLSLGPYLFVRNAYLELPLPFYAFRAIPGLDTMRVPGRFGLLAALGVYVLAAVALADLARRVPGKAPLLLVGAGVVTLVELVPPAPESQPTTMPEAYDVIAADEGDGAVLEVPIKWSASQDQIGFVGTGQDFLFLLYQEVHGKPMVSGSASRYPDEGFEALQRVPVYRQLLALADQPGFDDEAVFGAGDLAQLGIGYVVYHRDDPVPAALEYLRSLDLPLLVDDGTVIVWRVPEA